MKTKTVVATGVAIGAAALVSYLAVRGHADMLHNPSEKNLARKSGNDLSCLRRSDKPARSESSGRSTRTRIEPLP